MFAGGTGSEGPQQVLAAAVAREDQTSTEERELQERKFRDMTSYLVSAGYFRARASAVSRFDKVVGGMVWCITHIESSLLDVDVLFRGTQATTGQNIKLAEAIVTCVRALGCPVALQAHQIHGSDWKSVHPAIVWLIKRMFEARDDRAGRLRAYSEQQFDKAFLRLEASSAAREVADDDEDADAKAARDKFFEPIGDSRKTREPAKAPERRFRFAGDAARLASEESAVVACLLEYGDRVLSLEKQQQQQQQSADDDARRPKAASIGAAGAALDFEKAVKKALLAKEETDEAARQREQEAEQALQSDMAAAKLAGHLTGSKVGKMVRLGAGEIAEAAKKYEALSRNEKGSETTTIGQEKAVRALESRLEKAKATVDAARRKRRDAETRRNDARDALRSAKQEASEAREFDARIKAEIAKLLDLEKKCAQPQDLAELKRLVAENESRKRTETEFKTRCKSRLKELEAEAKSADKAIAQDAERVGEIEAVHAKVVAKDARLRRQVADKSRKIAAVARLVDDVPTRTELVQYERRFHELYAQVAAKLDETRKYYDLYNSLEEIQQIHSKEVTILNSVIETFSTNLANIRTKQGKLAFVKQLDDLNGGLKKNLQAKKDLFDKATERATNEHHLHQALVEEHRRYHAAVKEFHEECQKNDLLAKKLAVAAAAAAA